MFQHLVMSALQLAIDHDDDGITSNKHGPERLGNFFLQVDPCLQEPPSYMGNQTKVLQIPCPNITWQTQVSKLQPENMQYKNFLKCKILVRKFWWFNMHLSNSSDFSTVKVLCCTVVYLWSCGELTLCGNFSST